MATQTIPRPFPPFNHSEVRQVQVRDVPGISYLPVIPDFGSTMPITRVPNGTFVCFQTQTWGGPDDDCDAWVFSLQDNPACRFSVSPDALPYLWKVKAVHALPVRSR